MDFQVGTGRMPLERERRQPRRADPAYPPADIGALVDYVAEFAGDEPAIPRVRAGDIHTGRSLFLYNCAACHSTTGAGGTLPRGVVAPSLYEATSLQVAEAVRVGPGAMPAYPDTVLTDREVDAVVAYVEVLRNERGDIDRGGAPLGRIGPFTEGAVGLVVILLLAFALARRLSHRDVGGGRR